MGASSLHEPDLTETRHQTPLNTPATATVTRQQPISTRLNSAQTSWQLRPIGLRLLWKPTRNQLAQTQLGKTQRKQCYKPRGAHTAAVRSNPGWEASATARSPAQSMKKARLLSPANCCGRESPQTCRHTAIHTAIHVVLHAPAHYCQSREMKASVNANARRHRVLQASKQQERS